MKFPLSFYAASREYTTYSHPVNAPAMRHSFVVADEKVGASLLICGLGFYKLYINGKEITKTMLAPYITNPDDILYYDSYDLTGALLPGENVIGIVLGNGMLNCPGGAVWDFEKARYRGAPRVALSFECGDTRFDASVLKWAPSAITFDDLRSGCFYDATLEKIGWNDIGFDDKDWSPVIPIETPRGEPRICDVDPIGVRYELSPICIKKDASFIPRQYNHGDIDGLCGFGEDMPTSGGVMFDFGLNGTGLTRLVVRNATPGQRIDILHSELVEDDGTVNPGNIASFYPIGFSQRDSYICRGDEYEEFVPSFTYHGFRYCYVTGLRDDQIDDKTLTYLVCSTKLREIGDFKSSSRVLNRLQTIVRNSDLSNFWHFPTDCPHREKNGWTGDASLSCEHFLLNLDCRRNLAEWSRCIRAAQLDDGRVPGIVPTGGWGFEWGCGPIWDAILFIIPYYCYILRGDLDTARESADAMVRYLHYASGKRDADGVVAYGLEDWCPCDEDRADAKNTPLAVTDTLQIIDCAAMGAFLFEKLGMHAEATRAKTLRGEMIAAFRKKFVDPDTMLVATGSQTAQACSIAYGIFEADHAEEERAFRVLLDLIRKSDFHMAGGVFGMRSLFHVLADHGEIELAYKIIMQPTDPSYRLLVDEGFTSLPEFIRSREYLMKRRPSFNHHFFGDISGFFIKDIAGIKVNPHKNDATEVLVAPGFIADLDFAEGSYETIGGRISVRWESVPEGDIKLTVTADEGVKGRIRLPRGYSFDDGYLGDRPIVNGKQILAVKKDK